MRKSVYRVSGLSAIQKCCSSQNEIQGLLYKIRHQFECNLGSSNKIASFINYKITDPPENVLSCTLKKTDTVQDNKCKILYFDNIQEVNSGIIFVIFVIGKKFVNLKICNFSVKNRTLVDSEKIAFSLEAMFTLGFYICGLWCYSQRRFITQTFGNKSTDFLEV